MGYARRWRLFWRVRIPLRLPEAPGGSARLAPERVAALRAHAARMQWRWENEAMPSPGRWQVPPGVRPAWNWIPPGGIRPRLERVPAWVRLWYRAPVADRYAYGWMWRHGGWDVLPPGGG